MCPVFICTLCNFEKNCMNKQIANSHLKIDICEIDIQGLKKWNIFSVVLSIKVVDLGCSLLSHNFLRVNILGA